MVVTTAAESIAPHTRPAKTSPADRLFGSVPAPLLVLGAMSSIQLEQAAANAFLALNRPELV